VLWFAVAVVGGGILYDFFARLFGEPVNSLVESIYTVLTLTFLQPPNRDFPNHIILQLFHFMMPIVGIVVLAQGLADFGSLLFNRRSRSKEWEMAVASTFNKHIILVGLGHLGYRIALQLHKMGEQFVVLEFSADTDTISVARNLGIPVIQDDATRPIALEGANVKDARTIILASQNDAMNLQIALKARSINPKINVVVRIFDDDFAHALQDQFGFIALSATEMAAPVFAAAAAGVDVTNPSPSKVSCSVLRGWSSQTMRPSQKKPSATSKTTIISTSCSSAATITPKCTQPTAASSMWATPLPCSAGRRNWVASCTKMNDPDQRPLSASSVPADRENPH